VGIIEHLREAESLLSRDEKRFRNLPKTACTNYGAIVE